jgi:hypothetical protein
LLDGWVVGLIEHQTNPISEKVIGAAIEVIANSDQVSWNPVTTVASVVS